MKTNIYLVKNYLRFQEDETPIREMRKRASVLWATDTREEAAQDVRRYVMEEKRRIFDNYKNYWFIQEVDLFKALSND